MTYFALLGRLLVLEVSVLHACGEAQGEAIDDCPDFKFPSTDSGNLCITALTNLILPRLPYVRRNLATPTILSLKPLPLFPFRPCTKSSILIYQGSLRRTFRGKRTCNGSHNCDDCVICVTCLFLERICGSVRSCFPIAHRTWVLGVSAETLLTRTVGASIPHLPASCVSPTRILDLQVGFCLVTCEI